MTPGVFGDINAEKSVIGALLQDSSCIWVLDRMVAEAFTRPEYRQVFQAARELLHKGQAADALTVASAVRSGGGDDLTMLLLDAVRYVPSTANVGAYVRIVAECHSRRTLRDACRRAVESLGEVDCADAADALMCDLRKSLDGTDAWVSFCDVGAKTFDMLEAIGAGKLRCIPTGMPDLDAALAGGLRNGELTVLAAGTGQGKSAFAMHIARMAAEKGFRVGFVSREMSVEQYGLRAIASLTGVDSGTLLRAAKLDAEKWAAISDAVARMNTLPISFAFRAATVEDVRREAVRKEGLDLLVVDYIQILGARDKYPNEHLRVSHVSRQLKEIALDLGIPVLALSQLRRAPGGVARKPSLSDLKESGSIENDADCVLFLYQPTGPEDDAIPTQYSGWVEAAEEMGDRFLLLEVAKQRMYSTGIVGACFNASRMTFYTPQTVR